MRRSRATARTDDGSSSIQAAVLYPVVMLLLLAVIQGGVYFHAQNVARTAASSAVQAARTATGTPADGHEAAARVLHQGGSSLRDVAVAVDRGPTDVTATITGTSMTLIPGWHPGIRQTASGTVERFTTGAG